MNNASQGIDPQPAYIQPLGLSEDPFREQPEDRFFYADPALMQRLDLMQHLTQFNDQLLFVRAPRGGGKTTLLRQLKLRAADHWQLCHLDGTALSSVAELFVQLSHCFPNAGQENTEDFASDLMSYCKGLQHNGRLAVVLVDDADRLPAGVLEALLRLDGSVADTMQSLRILLFATPGLEDLLQQAGLTSPSRSLLHVLDLPPFDEQQSAAYVMYRLAIAGYSGDSPFSTTEIRAMYKSAQGRPGDLNSHARQSLEEQAQRIAGRRRPAAASSAGRTGAPRWLKWVIGAAVLAGIAVSAGYWSNRQSGDLDRLVAGTSERPISLPPAESTATAGPAPLQTDSRPEAPPPTAAPGPARPPEAAGPASPPEAAPGPAATTAPAPPEPVTPPETPTPQAQATEAPPAVSAGQPPTPEPQPDTQDRPGPEATDTASPPGETAADPAPTAAAGPQGEVEAPIAGTTFRTWFDAQPASHYTLQLLGARQPATVAQFVDRHAGIGHVGRLSSRYQGDAWYIAVYGSFPTREAAQRAINGLPRALQDLKPWIRGIEAVRESLAPAPSTPGTGTGG